MDSPAQIAANQLRFRRILNFGDVLDESMLLFRRHWITFAVISAVSLLPPSLVLVWLSGAGLMSRTVSLADFSSGRLSDPAAVDTQIAQVAALSAYFFVYSVFGILWTAGVVVTADTYLRGGQPSLAAVYGRSIRRYFSVLVSTILVFLGLLVLLVLSAALFVITVFGILGSLIATVGLLFWWLNPGTRKTWLKWLIILTAPFGLSIYIGTRWGLYLLAAVLEDKGPVDALSRSMELTDGHWFRVGGILAIASLIVGVMAFVLGLFITVPFTIAEAFRGQFGLNPTEAAISSALNSVVNILLLSIGPIVYTVLFLDLRNRREATDIAERVSQLEAAPLPANG